MSRGVVLTEWNRFARAEMPAPQPGAGEVVVQALYTGLCGTDLHIVEGSHPRARTPLAIGHEIAGRPESGSLAGRLVVVDPLLPCGACPACRAGASNACARLRLIGIDRDGGLAGRLVAAAERLHPVPESVPPEIAPLTEPLAVAVHAVGRVPGLTGRLAVVVGAGPVGLLLAHVARHHGARVLVAERVEGRRSLAASFGFELLDAEKPADQLAELTNGDLADVIFDAAAAPAVAADLHRFVKSTGYVAVVGSYGGLTPIDMQAVMFKELTLQGHRTYLPADIDAALELLSTDMAVLRPIVSRVAKADDVELAIAALRAGELLKVIVECPR
jgi:(R,R)-butanediol dehydrogenase/meso-butanediol dehydrogenase/diacetyl reductase